MLSKSPKQFCSIDCKSNSVNTSLSGRIDTIFAGYHWFLRLYDVFECSGDCLVIVVYLQLQTYCKSYQIIGFVFICVRMCYQWFINRLAKQRHFCGDFILARINGVRRQQQKTHQQKSAHSLLLNHYRLPITKHMAQPPRTYMKCHCAFVTSANGRSHGLNELEPISKTAALHATDIIPLF